MLKDCAKIPVIIEYSELSMYVDIEHIINGKYQLLKDSLGAFRTIEFKGGLLAETIRKIEQEGMVKIHSLYD